MSRRRLTGFKEKPTVDYLVSMGVYGVSKRVLVDGASGSPYGFDDLMRDLLATGERVDDPLSRRLLGGHRTSRRLHAGDRRFRGAPAEAARG